MKFGCGNFQREIDNTDVAVVRAYERSLEEFYGRIAKIDMRGKASGIYAAVCEAGFGMLDNFFGEGASREMFGESQSVRKVMTAVCSLNDMMNDVSGVVDKMKELSL